jgi:hypothetical protein
MVSQSAAATEQKVTRYLAMSDDACWMLDVGCWMLERAAQKKKKENKMVNTPV